MITILIAIVLVVIITVIYANNHSNSHNSPHIHRFIVNGKPYDIDVSRPIDTDSYISNINKGIDRLQAQNKVWEKRYAQLIAYQEKGSQCEKQGKIDEAIKEYNNAIDYGFSFTDDFGVNHFYHSIERLIILYRKRKDYDNELRIIDLALSDELTENDRKNLLHRKARTLSLINKLEL